MKERALCLQKSFFLMIASMAMVLATTLAAQAAPITVSTSIGAGSVFANAVDLDIYTNASADFDFVRIAIYYDFNSNGIIDSEDYPLQGEKPRWETIKDNNPTSDQLEFLTSDLDGVQPDITTTLSSSAYFAPGQYIVYVENSSVTD